MSDGIPTEAVKLHVTCRGDTGKILQKCNVSTLEQSRTVHYFVAAKSVLGLSTSRSKPSQIRDCLDPFDMPIALIELELNICNDSVKFRMEMRKLAVVVHVPHGTQNFAWSFHVLVFQRTVKKCTKIYNARAQMFYSLNLVFGGVPCIPGT